MTTLVICVDRSGDIGRKTSVPMPVAGWEAVRSLVTDVGLADPEDVSVNCLLEALRVTRELRDEREDAIVAVVSGGGDSPVGSDRSVAAQLDDLVDRYDPTSAIVVVDSAEDERVLPIVESRMPVDSVDRVVVRQAHDIQSTYYLLKQFLADEELRSTVLVPLGVALLVLPVLFIYLSPGAAVAGLAGLLGAVLLYKGLAIDVYVAAAPDRVREALYAGQVSIVTYVVAAGLTLVGLFFGALEVSDLSGDVPIVVEGMQFTFSAIPWLTVAGLTAAIGRVLDELIRDEEIRSAYLNLPFVILAIGLVIRGFAGYFLEQERILEHLVVAGVTFTPVQRLVVFVVTAIVVSIVGVKAASGVGTEGLGEVIDGTDHRGDE